MATFNVTDETFDEQVIKSSVPVVIDFLGRVVWAM